MSRVKFLERKQSNFLNDLKRKRILEWSAIAKICKVHRRTLFDWRRDKYQMSYDSLQLLKKKLRFSVPKIKVLPDDWNIKNAARLGALRRNELYGSPGTPEGRRKGGLTTARNYRLNPQKFKETGFTGPKEINYPSKSPLFSEAIGIILGDGCITKYQVKISLNIEKEKEYAKFIMKFFKELFGFSGVFKPRKNNACDLVFSSVKLVKYLTKMGLKIGDKIAQQVGIPKWILADRECMAVCLRGLIDTDGGVYYHNHVTKGNKYRHLGLGFTSHSFPLLKDTYNILVNLEFPAKIRYNRHIFLYDRSAIKKYFADIGTHNKHHYLRFSNYFKYGEVPKWSQRERLESV